MNKTKILDYVIITGIKDINALITQGYIPYGNPRNTGPNSIRLEQIMVKEEGAETDIVGYILGEGVERIVELYNTNNCVPYGEPLFTTKRVDFVDVTIVNQAFLIIKPSEVPVASEDTTKVKVSKK